MSEWPYSGVAVLIPCLNEEITVGRVVGDFRKYLPGAQVYVFDNNSTDRTAAVAREAGARVIPSPRPGKGNVIRHMFAAVEADIYIMADGDDTYPAAAAPNLIAELRASQADMIVGMRMASFKHGSFPTFHRFGNRVISWLISVLFHSRVTDVLSGYRAFSRDLVQGLPLTATGFEIETELTLQAITKEFTIKELPIDYGQRPSGSFSKLDTFADGMLILKAIIMVFKDYRPLLFFSLLGLFFLIISLTAGVFPIIDYLEERYVHRVPLAILAAGTGILAFLCASIGLVLDTVARYQKENYSWFRRLAKRLSGPDAPKED